MLSSVTCLSQKPVLFDVLPYKIVNVTKNILRILKKLKPAVVILAAVKFLPAAVKFLTAVIMRPAQLCLLDVNILTLVLIAVNKVTANLVLLAVDVATL